MRVVVAMSGGIDSSVAAAMLQEQGYEVIGITLHLWPRQIVNHGARCCDFEAIASSRSVARRLGIPHYVVDFREVFRSVVIDDFCRQYLEGRTPNPCVRCNRYIKFGTLWDKAASLGASFIATGHYARTEREGPGGRVILKKGADRDKDQSYFLYSLTQAQLARSLFPVGHLTKARVKQIAAEKGLGLDVSIPESQEICFIPDNNYAAFIGELSPQGNRPGPILDERGNILGQHRGIAAYTIGQRRGLNIAATRPVYVTAIMPEENAIIVGPKEQTYARELVAGELNWIAIDPPDNTIRVKARIRYRQPESEALVTPLDETSVSVKFSEPQMAITPGQAVVFYDGERVIGGGTIVRSGR